MNNPQQPSTYAINVNHLQKAFNNKLVVNNVSISVKRGEIFGFLGPNGSGKTTTIRMLCGLLTPDSGEGQCLGYNIMTQSSEIKFRTGYMTQAFSYYEDLTVRENLDFIARTYQIKNKNKKIESILDNLFFDQSQRNQLTGTLSGGWKQRVALAGALIHDPELLLLDEPTGGVDPKARREFWDIIHQLSQKGVTTLVSTHYMDEATRCNRLAYIVYGKLMATGTIDEIISAAALSTWEIQGNHLHKLMSELKQLPGVGQVSFFGNNLHVSGQNAALLQKTILPLQNNSNYTIKPVDTSLEDIFIHFVNQVEERE